MGNNKDKNKNQNNIVNVIIKKRISDDTVQIYAEFEAEEIVLDGVRTLFSEDANFREDATVREHPEITELKDMLERKDLKTKEEKIDEVRKLIIEEEKKLIKEKSKPEKDPDSKEKEKKKEKEKEQHMGRLNILNEQARLIKLKILKNVLKYDGRGSYVIFLPDGKRQYEFMYEDGLLYPIKHIIMEHTMCPNEGSMVRIHRSWVNRLAEDLAGTQLDHWGKIWMVIMIIATTLTFIGSAIWSFNVAQDAKELPLECSEAMISVSKQVVEIARSINIRVPGINNIEINQTQARQIQKT